MSADKEAVVAAVEKPVVAAAKPKPYPFWLGGESRLPSL